MKSVCTEMVVELSAPRFRPSTFTSNPCRSGHGEKVSVGNCWNCGKCNFFNCNLEVVLYIYMCVCFIYLFSICVILPTLQTSEVPNLSKNLFQGTKRKVQSSMKRRSLTAFAACEACHCHWRRCHKAYSSPATGATSRYLRSWSRTSRATTTKRSHRLAVSMGRPTNGNHWQHPKKQRSYGATCCHSSENTFFNLGEKIRSGKRSSTKTVGFCGRNGNVYFNATLFTSGTVCNLPT